MEEVGLKDWDLYLSPQLRVLYVFFFSFAAASTSNNVTLLHSWLFTGYGLGCKL